MPRWLAGSLVFLASGSVLVMEILAGRLLAPYVGVSLTTFTGIIGVVLAGIAAGAWLGGSLADRFPPRPLLAAALVLGGATAMLAIPIIRLLGRGTASPGFTTVATLATLGFFLPSMLLSAVTPIVVKIQLASVADTGKVVGVLSALGTAGSLTGVVLTGYVLLGAFPTTPVVVVLGALLVVVGLAVGLAFHHVGGPRLPTAVAVVGLALGGLGAATAALDNPCGHETTYYCVTVQTPGGEPGRRILWLDDLQHSYVDLADPTFLGHNYARMLSDVVDTVDPPGALDVVHVGGGGFTLPRYLAATRPGTRSTVLELDRGLVEIAQDELGLVLSDDLQVRTGDARGRLRQLADASADLVVGDAFGGRAVPYHLTTREFVNDIHRVLRPGGTYVANLIDTQALAFVRAEAATLRTVFAHVGVLARPSAFAGEAGGNVILMASDAPLPAAAIRAHADARDGGVELRVDADLDAFVGDADILTDDHAPVDQLLTRGL